jgi:hypothetical protein
MADSLLDSQEPIFIHAKCQLAYTYAQIGVVPFSDAFPLRKAEGLGIAKILGLVKAQNLL